MNSNRSTIDSAEYLLNKNVLADDLRMFERVNQYTVIVGRLRQRKKLYPASRKQYFEDIAHKVADCK